MLQSTTQIAEPDDVVLVLAGPTSPDEDETFGPEPDDPRAAGAYADHYDVPDYDPAHEQHDCCCQGVHG